jgi:hypothetical protein
MAGRVAHQIGLGLDDPAADLSLGQFAQDGLADQEAGERDRIGGQRLALEQAGVMHSTSDGCSFGK